MGLTVVRVSKNRSTATPKACPPSSQCPPWPGLILSSYAQEGQALSGVGVSWAMDSPALFLNLFIYLVCEFCLWVNSNLGAFKMLLLGSWVKGASESSHPESPRPSHKAHGQSR